MNSWLIRPFPHNINRCSEFRSEEFIAIGWPEIGDLSGKSREDIKEILSGEPYNLKSLALGNAYATVDIFVNQIEIGDLILMPSDQDIYFGIIESDYYLESEYDTQELGCGHRRKVKWLDHCMRQELSKGLRSSLKAHRTVANLSAHSEEISARSKGEKLQENMGGDKVVTITYPLRPGFIVKFDIPKDMSKDESVRLSTFLSTLYFTE